MSRFSNYISKWLPARKQTLDEDTAEQLRIAFRDRYHSFKLLLNANNRALQKMADIEQALAGNRLFGMAFIRERCTSASVNVLQMIRNLDRLASGRYTALFSKFNLIKLEIDAVLSEKRPFHGGPLVISLKDIERSMTGVVGNKMAALGDIRNNKDISVPDGFAVTTSAYDLFIRETGLQDEINRLTQFADPEDVEELYNLGSRIQSRILEAPVPDSICDAMTRAWEALASDSGRPLTVALRSSALGEDSAGSSFAGQYHSELNVNRERLFDAYKSVLAGKYSLQAISYRFNRGFRDDDIPMAVGCIKMVDALAGGVIYSRNPLDMNDTSIYIHSVWGLPKSVVDGTVPCDVFVVSRTDPLQVIREDIRSKDVKYVCYEDEGICRDQVTGDTAADASITDEQKIRLAAIAVDLETYYGGPQDIEWAIDDDNRIKILQCRPLQEKPDITPPPASEKADAPVIATGGITVSPGAAGGSVVVVEKRADTFRFPKGSILVARQALPVWAVIVNQASAVITEQGSVAGHLASVAREFNVPAIFGLQDALAQLTPGRAVTVDADNRIIYEGYVRQVIDAAPRPVSPMSGSPVYQILKNAGDKIIPLSLLDPDAETFSPDNCRTLHDITRFIHEKSVVEMFNFGKDHNFPERSSKQFYFNVPMQWWVLNLDDGLTREVTGKYVKLKDIVSIPMLAFWQGFAAVPWDGPPSVDGKGLMAVMFQSTMNTALVPGVRSSFAERNYFMISKNFCSINSRMGYHFAFLESLISDRNMENYITFQFKGGAADDVRRKKRVVFIGEILEHYGFRVTIRQDHLTARIEGEDQTYMKSRMAILGYLTLHTRQLDMIMTNPAQVAYYDNKLKKDIDEHILL